MPDPKNSPYPPCIQTYVDKLVGVLTHGSPETIGYIKGVLMGVPYRDAAPSAAPPPRRARKASVRLKLVYSKEV